MVNGLRRRNRGAERRHRQHGAVALEQRDAGQRGGEVGRSQGLGEVEAKPRCDLGDVFAIGDQGGAA